MWRRIAALAAALSLAAFGQEIHLKARSIRGSAVRQGVVTGRHRVILFDHAPGVEDLGALAERGAQVVSVLPDNAVMVAASSDAVNDVPGVKWIGQLEAADKLSPELQGAGELLALIEFHSDVDKDAQDAIAAAEGISFLRPPLLAANHVIVSAGLDELEALTGYDEIGYIFPADPELLSDPGFNTCAGMLTASGPVAQYANIVHGWDPGPDGAAHLAYVFTSLTAKAPAVTVQGEVVRAFFEWAKFTNVIFSAGSTAAAPHTIAVRFASGAHGDAYNFDGPGGILAHTFYPVPVNPESIAGDMHLDADENWHAGSDVDIYSVALHEAGHALGLGHSDKPGDVMYPYYRRGMSLSANDIGAVQRLYGAPAATPPATVQLPDAAPAPLPLQLTVGSYAASVQTAQTSLSGTFTGGTAPFGVQWQTDHGYSGRASLNSTANTWSSGPVTLVPGVNNISISVYDGSHAAATQTIQVSYAPPQAAFGAAASAPISIAITAPAANVTTVNAAAVSISGTAAGASGITRVTWQTAAGAAGTAIGTARWTASSVPLLKGTNSIVIRAYDANGATAWKALVVVRNY